MKLHNDFFKSSNKKTEKFWLTESNSHGKFYENYFRERLIFGYGLPTLRWFNANDDETLSWLHNFLDGGVGCSIPASQRGGFRSASPAMAIRHQGLSLLHTHGRG
jgi:hypothetical protein